VPKTRKPGAALQVFQRVAPGFPLSATALLRREWQQWWRPAPDTL